MNNTNEISKPTILYVDDDIQNLTSFKALFRRLYNIFLASSAQEAIDILRSNEIMVIITDQRMPGMTGSELLAIAAEEFPGTLRFMLTGFTDYNPLVDAINKGRLHGYFSKPFDPECIKSKINTNLKSYYLELENIQLLNKLQQSEQFLDTIIESIPHMISVKEAENLSLVRVNRAGEELLGYQRDELMGKTVYDLFPEEEAEHFTLVDRQVLSSGKLFDIHEEKIETRHKGVRWLHTQKTPVLDQNGKPQFLLTISQDITEHKIMVEREANLEKQLKSNKVQALGRLARGVAHDFNNMLSPIINYTEMLKMDIPYDSPLNVYLDGIYRTALRSKDMVRQILTLSRQQEQKVTPIKLEPVIKEALQLIRSSFPPAIQIKEIINEDCGVVLADSTQIHQIIMNLATNGCHAMEPNGGLLTVELTQTKIDNPDNAGMEFVCLKITDTGTGIDESIIDKVFDPYFTTKESGKGTGLGLSVVQGIVKSYRGDINIRSTLGTGTDIVIYLPVHH